jgi:hypothetical protein
MSEIFVEPDFETQLQRLNQILWRMDGCQVHSFKRRGRSDRIIFVHERDAGEIKKLFPTAQQIRSLQKDRKAEVNKSECRVVWESVGPMRWGRLRKSPARATRPAVNLYDLPMPGNDGESTLDVRFFHWLAHHGIKAAGPDAQKNQLLMFAAFMVGSIYHKVRRDKKLRLPLDQNIQTGHRYHIFKENALLGAPFAAHVLVYSAGVPQFETTEPGIGSRFSTRESVGKTLIAESDGGAKRFFINKDVEWKNPMDEWGMGVLRREKLVAGYEAAISEFKKLNSKCVTD